jgi:hypothetical protein
VSIANPRSASRPAPRRQPHRLVRAATLLRRLLSAVGLRQHPPPPYFNERLCRDIGIEPPPKAEQWPWPWYDRRA